MASMEIEKLSKQGEDALRKEDYEKAFLCGSKILQLDPQNLEALVFRGIARVGKGDLDGAIIDWNKALELNPNIAAAYANRGNAYQRKGELDEAWLIGARQFNLIRKMLGTFTIAELPIKKDRIGIRR
jgi:tetratricopeptide (TPR) repeat protein